MRVWKSVYNFIHLTLSSLKRNTGFKEFHGNLSQKKVGEKLKEYLEYLDNYQQYLSVYRSGKYPPTHTHLTEGHRQRVRVENTKGEKNLKRSTIYKGNHKPQLEFISRGVGVQSTLTNSLKWIESKHVYLKMYGVIRKSYRLKLKEISNTGEIKSWKALKNILRNHASQGPLAKIDWSEVITKVNHKRKKKLKLLLQYKFSFNVLKLHYPS